ncbi:unnamed protein product [Prorocentrum cordatum]|uniref:Palmitoyltransferase n=1 Tax=Prorocentrum cordatum TaxID=2364126 RepID=A0ABN9VK70_9DINO|nr:unnamed protein product [Polarella glacialis]
MLVRALQGPGGFKPDRCHHCKVCGTCILKMDHHCPWIYNCVGYFNYKYFFLVIFYSVIALHMIFWTMFESVERSLEDDREPFLTSFLTLFGVTLAASLGFIVTLFGMFHAWLICKGLSTIELFEKQGERRDDATLGELICGDAYTQPPPPLALGGPISCHRGPKRCTKRRTLLHPTLVA